MPTPPRSRECSITTARFSDSIDPVPVAARVSLGEGNTPLVRSRHIGPRLGLANLFFKLEISNPTASYKDRFAAAAVSHMVAAGKKRSEERRVGKEGRGRRWRAVRKERQETTGSRAYG